MKIHIVISALLLFTCHSVFAQSKIKKDTIYYMLDTSKVPVKDRVMNVKPLGNSRVVELSCRCLPDSRSPTFYLREGTTKYIDVFTVRNIKFISLIRFIKVIQHDNTRLFHAGHDVFFIEPDGKKFKITPGEFMYIDPDPIEP